MLYLDNIPYEAFFAIYLIIACNFIGEVFGCKFRQLLQNNMLIKHFFAFLTLMFLDLNILKDFDLVLLSTSIIENTTFLIFDLIIKFEQGGVLP